MGRVPMSRRSSRGRRARSRPGWQWWAWVLAAAALVIAAVVGILDYAPRLFRQAPVAPGDKAPTFVLESSGGERVNIADYLGREPVLLIFFPGYR